MKNLLLAGVFFLLFFSVLGCNDDEVTPDDDGDPPTEENRAPVADAGADLEGNTGSTVALNGSGSSDPDEDDLTYSWTITTKPETSEATIANNEEVSASFVPDVAGAYTIELTVSDGELSDSDEVLVAVTGDPLETVIVSENIDEETTWVNIFNDPNVPDYLVERNISINAKLTIEPGVVVHLKDKVKMTVETGGGSIIAEGEENNRITFTSFNEDGEVLWGGILIKSSSTQNSFKHVDIAFAGGEGLVYAGSWRKASIGIDQNGRLGISNSTIRRSGGDGVFVVRQGAFTTFENNTFSQNTDFPLSLSINQVGSLNATNIFQDDESTGDRENVIRIYDSILEDDQEWTDLGGGASYRIVGDASVEAMLTINEGVLLEFDQGVTLTVNTEGALIAKGTEDNPVVMTSSDISSGKKWGGILFKSSTIQNELNHVSVLHAGGDPLVYYGGWRTGNIGLDSGAKVKLTNSEIAHSNGHGLVLHGNAGLQAFEGNNFHDNSDYPILLSANMAGMVDANTVIESNAHNVVAIYESQFTNNAAFNDNSNPQWVALNGDAKYLVTGKLTLEDDLVIEEGAYLAFADGVMVEVTSDGSLKAVGSADNKVTLTAYEQDGNHNWYGIVFKSANTNNQFQNAEVSYAGNGDGVVYISGWRKTSIGVDRNASLDISSTNVTNSKGHAIAIHPESNTTIGTGVNFSNNALEDVFKME